VQADLTSGIHQTNDRRLPADYTGDILVWDIDKTYLDTRFSSLRGLMAIPFEFAVDKRAIPGAAPLLRALRRGPGKASMLVPLYFISGSPPQLRSVIERKMTLDGVEFDGITFKDQWGLLKKGKVRAIKAQVGYKLKALLLYRRELPDRARWLLFGDDVEDDAAAFVLFGRIAAGLRGTMLRDALEQNRVSEEDIARIDELAETLPIAERDPVERIFIHLERKTEPSAFPDPRIAPTRSFLQTALVLSAMGRISGEAVSTVAKDMRLRHVPEAEIASHLGDAIARLGITQELASPARRS
jgi:uncharacterized protein DUF2183